jgi:hypothetical protein
MFIGDGRIYSDGHGLSLLSEGIRREQGACAGADPAGIELERVADPTERTDVNSIRENPFLGSTPREVRRVSVNYLAKQIEPGTFDNGGPKISFFFHAAAV